MRERPGEAVVGLCYVPRLPIALPEGVPAVDQGGVVLDGLSEQVFCLFRVSSENIESLATKVLVGWRRKSSLGDIFNWPKVWGVVLTFL